MKTILIFGLRRSGNHFVISILLQNYKNCIHINNTILSYDNYNIYKNIDISSNRIDGNYTGFKNADCVIISMENKIIDYDELNKFNEINDLNILLLLRNPYNNLSSVWKVYDKDLVRTNEIIELWQLYAKIFINDKKLIKILYDEFSINNNYIINILNKIGIENINFDKNIYILHQQSSFEDINQSKKTYSSLESCIYKDDEQFIKLFENTQIDYLWNEILKYNLT
jgi:hypothetical protein